MDGKETITVLLQGFWEQCITDVAVYLCTKWIVKKGHTGSNTKSH
jgi:hypothetical protein